MFPGTLQLCPQNSVYCIFTLFHCKIFYHSPLWITSYFELYSLHLNISGFSTFLYYQYLFWLHCTWINNFVWFMYLFVFMNHSMIYIGEYSLHILKYCMFCCFGVQCSIKEIRKKCLIVLFFYILYILIFFYLLVSLLERNFIVSNYNGWFVSFSF